MSVPKFFEEATGWWEGTSSLNLPWERKEPYESHSSLHVECGPRSTYAHLEYRWSHGEKLQHGVLIVAGSKKVGTISIGWVDSWHQSPSVLDLSGKWESEHALTVLGHYSDGSGPQWGWKIELRYSSDLLHLEMTNVEPSGKAEWAVRCDYKRT